MKLMEELYIADSVTSLESAVYNLRRRTPVFRLYCIVYFADRNRFEIMTSFQLFSDKNKDRESKIFGLAKGQRSAYTLLCGMLEDVLRENKDLNAPATWFSDDCGEVI